MKTNAELILTNGKIFTLWDERPWASAIAIKGERILAVGEDSEIADLRSSRTEVIDLKGKTVIPGLTDSHAHLIYYGKSSFWADIGDCDSIKDLQTRLRKHQETKPSDWILGWGFDEELFAERRYPTREELDEVSPDIPVFICRLCGHACVVNSKAIELAEADKLTESGKKTGLFTEDDMGPIWAAMPETTIERISEAALFAMNKALSTGITSAHCLIKSYEELTALRQLHEAVKLPIRLYLGIGYGIFERVAEEGQKTGSGDSMLKIGPVKMFADGSMGARTAALSEEYLDDPGNRGMYVNSPAEVSKMVESIHNSGWQAAIHAIGDDAVDKTIDAIESALNRTGENNSVRRHRVEHASILREDIVERMAKLKIFTSVQPQFVITDFWTFDRIGPERNRWAYPFKTMMKKGIPISFGSDCPVENLDAFELLHRAVTRDAYSPDESLSMEDAVRIYALGGAFAAFEEADRGSIQPGKLADFAVLDRDVFTILHSEILDCKTELVFVAGKIAKK